MVTASLVCECGWDKADGKPQALVLHKRRWCPLKAKEEAPVAEMPIPALQEPRSDRGRRRRARELRVLTPLEQIRGKPVDVTGPWAYFINPEGATIRDALLLYPNGARLPRSEDRRGKFSENAEYFQARQKAKGYEYVGPTLNDAGVRRLIEVLELNREDEVLDLEDLIAQCAHDIANSDRPEWRDNQRKRRDQLQKRLDTVRAGFDPEKLIAELNEIARAQRMSRVDPNVLAVMREMVGEMNAQFAAAVSKFAPTGEMLADNDPAYQGKAYIE